MIIETKEITNSEDVIDVRDVIARFEELETERENHCEGDTDSEAFDDLATFDESEEGQEYSSLKSLLEDLEGNGGDEQWRGSWYPVTLIRESYFKDYAEQLAEDIGAINAEASWPNKSYRLGSCCRGIAGRLHVNGIRRCDLLVSITQAWNDHPARHERLT